MKTYPDFRLVGRPLELENNYMIVPAEANIDNSEELESADNIGYSTRSRIARLGYNTGILPWNFDEIEGEYDFIRGLNGEFDYENFRTKEDIWQKFGRSI